MLAQLSFEIADRIVEYLDFNSVRSIARVCSAFRLPAQLRLFKSIRIISNAHKIYPNHGDSILSSPYLLQYASSLMVSSIGPTQQTSMHSLWSHLPTMPRLVYMHIYLQPDDCSRALSALEGLGLTREIALNIPRDLAPDMLISDHPLPVHSFDVYVDASTHHVVTRLLQKCSQSLRKLFLDLQDNIAPPLPFLPHLYELTIRTTLDPSSNDSDLVSWFPFLSQHPSITRISLGSRFTLAVQPPPDLLPNLQFLDATPAMIERLIPGRPVNDIRTEYAPQIAYHFPDDIMLQLLRQPYVSVTTLAILTNAHLPNDGLIKIVQALPKLRDFTADWPCDEVRQFCSKAEVFRIDLKQDSAALEGLLTALGKCKDVVHIRLYPSVIRVPPGHFRRLWSRGDFVQMVQRLQENGAAGLRSFELRAVVSFRQQGCEAIRVGWLDIPRQPTLRGEWQFYMDGSF